MADEEIIYQKPDDPYTISMKMDDTGCHIIVSADILPGEDPTEATAEAQRRADMLKESLMDFFDQSMKRMERG